MIILGIQLALFFLNPSQLRSPKPVRPVNKRLLLRARHQGNIWPPSQPMPVMAEAPSAAAAVA